MARPREDEPLDLTRAHDLTAGVIRRFQLPPGKKSQAFLRDGKGNGLGVRVTPSGAKAFVYEARSRVHGVIRLTLGSVDTWSIDQARVWARQQQSIVDAGDDPRAVKAQKIAVKAAEAAQAKAIEERDSLTGLDAWREYVEEGRTSGFSTRGPWGQRHYEDHLTFADAGGQPFKRGKGNTAPGQLYELLSRPLVAIDQNAIEDWLRRGNSSRPTRTALAFRLLRGFLSWCKEHSRYQHIAHFDAHKPKAVRKLIRRQRRPRGVLEREKLNAWFTSVRAIPEPTRSVYLQCVLLTGARKSEIAQLLWSDVLLKFGGTLRLKDKVEGLREIPCTPEVSKLLKSLPKVSLYVFGEQAATIAHNATYNHRKALKAAGLPHLTLQALRKSYGTLAEWVEPPAGVIAQIQGHKPSATAEQSYRERPLDMLRVWAVRIEEWMLAEARLPVSSTASPRAD